MARNTKKIQTFHPLAVIASLEAQNDAVGMMLATVESALSIAGDSLPAAIRDQLRQQLDACRAAMWPNDD